MLLHTDAAFLRVHLDGRWSIGLKGREILATAARSLPVMVVVLIVQQQVLVLVMVVSMTELEMVAILAVVTAVLFLGLDLRQEKRVLRGASYRWIRATFGVG